VARRRSRVGGTWGALCVLALLAGGAYWWSARSQPDQTEVRPGDLPKPAQPERVTKLAAATDDRESVKPESRAIGRPTPADTRASAIPEAVLAEADQLAAGGKPVAARRRLAAALGTPEPPAGSENLRQRLYALADETIFGAKIYEGDPLTGTHVIRPGEVLHRVGAQYKVTAELLAMINGIANVNQVRQGQRIKIVNGPFHAVVLKGNFDMYVYLQDTLVRHFKVGLGANGSTPTGTWRVREKLRNPTYHPPRGGPIIAADDPTNPLGEHWIGLEGVDGDAVGQTGYGIHGTIEPQSIGRSQSLGCIRLLNEEAELLFNLLLRDESTVVVRD